MPRLDPATGLKTCSRCRIPQLPKEFSAHTRSFDGLQSTCKTCAGKATARSRKKHPEKVKANQKRADANYRRKYPERLAEYQAYYRAQKKRKKGGTAEQEKSTSNIGPFSYVH